MSLISQNIINHYSELNEDGEMSFMFGRFADAHRGEDLLVFNAFYTALQNGEVNCYIEECDHSSCPVWDYYLEWVIDPMIEEYRNINSINEVRRMVQEFQQAYEPQMVQRIKNLLSNRTFIQVFRGFEQSLGAQTTLSIFIGVELIDNLQD